MHNLYLCLASLFLLSCQLSAQFDHLKLDLGSKTKELEAYERYQKVLSINSLGQKYQLKSRNIFTHKLDSLIFESLHEQGSSLGKSIYISDEKSDIRISLSWEDNGWEAVSYRIDNYNVFGQNVSFTTHILDGIDGENPILDKPILIYNESTYDQNNKLIKIEGGYFNSPESETTIKKYFYDDRGRLSEFTSSRNLPQLDTTLKLQHDYYFYDDGLDTLIRIDTYELDNWTSPNANWIFSYQTNFIYNDNSQLDSLATFWLLDSVLIQSNLFTFQYNNETKVENQLEYSRYEDNEWQRIRQTDYVYGEHGSLTELHNYYIKLFDLILIDWQWDRRYYEIFEHDPNVTFSEISNFRLFESIKYLGNSPYLLLRPFQDKMILSRKTRDFSGIYPNQNYDFYYGEYNTVNTNETSVDVVSISPNPAVSNIFINSNSLVIDEIRIYDINGQFISKSPYSRELDVSTLKPGVYLLELISGDKRFVERFSKVE